MQALDPEQRITNLSPAAGKRAHCRVCDDNGWAEAASRVDTYNERSAVVMEMAPCPFCERGYRQEFPSDRLQARADAIRPPWGWTEGYWQGRDLPDELVEQYVASQQPQRMMSQAEQLAAIRQLSATLIGSVDEEIEPR